MLNDRLEIASRVLAGMAAGGRYYNGSEKTALSLADALIAAELETRAKLATCKHLRVRRLVDNDGDHTPMKAYHTCLDCGAEVK
jgi:hypothetical protein